MDAAQWSVAVPTRSVNADGSVVVVAQVTDAVTGESGTVTVTLTVGRDLKVIADGLTLAGYQAWSTA